MADQRKGKISVLGIILAILIAIILILIVAIILNRLSDEAPAQPTESDVPAQPTGLDIRNNVFSIYQSEGAEKVQEYYDNLEKDVKNTDEKKTFLNDKIINLYSACGWGCSDQILDSVHRLYALDPQGVESYDLCYYEEFYVDDDPIAPCTQEESGEYDDQE